VANSRLVKFSLSAVKTHSTKHFQIEENCNPEQRPNIAAREILEAPTKEGKLCNRKEVLPMTQTGRIQVKGVKKKDVSVDDIAYLYYLMGKSAVRAKREREAQEKKKRQGGKK
jgi:hypothetical protein